MSELRRIDQKKIDHPATSTASLTMDPSLAQSGGKGCFTGDTEILVYNYGKVTLEWLANNMADRKFEVRSINSIGREVSGKAIKPRITKYVREIAILTFSDGSIVKCTPDHKFLLANMEYKEAKDLQVNDELKIVKGKYLHVVNTELTQLDADTPVYDITVNKYQNFALSNGAIVHNSKDIADAVAGCVLNLYQDIDKAGQLSLKYKVNSQIKFMEERAKKNDAIFDDMIKGIY